ncbi:MAG: hypothetical protein IPJ41_17135 [Phycisphaerales bacterium]|nr:hypothetical protein [Phycisphaerales bacterium]
MSMLTGLLVAPLAMLVFVALSRWAPRVSVSEVLLASLVLTPLILILELLAFSILPMESPLHALLPWGHLAMLGIGTLAAVRFHVRGSLRRLSRRAARIWRASDVPTRIVGLVAALPVGIAFLYAGWNAADEHDGAMYRLYVVMQPVQDGRIGRIPYPWPHFADSYPRTVELLYSWTMLCTRSSVGFNLVNWYFLCVFGVATFVLARRLSLRLQHSVLCALLAVTTQMPLYLTGLLYNDLAPAALFIAGVAFAVPPRRRNWSKFDLAACALAFGLGASAKATVALGCGLVAGTRLLWMAIPKRSPAPSRSGVSLATAVSVMALAGAAAGAQYIRCWMVYGSPIWPLRFSLGGRVVFDGPFDQQMLMITAKGNALDRWGAALFKLFQTTSQDANGVFGLLFAIAIIPACLWLVVRTARRPTLTNLLLLVATGYAFALPASSTLRYSLHLIPLCYVVLMCMLSRLACTRKRGLLAIVFGVFLVINGADYLRAVAREVGQQVRWGVSLADPERNRAWYYQFAYWDGSTFPETHTAVHKAMKPGERLVYATHTFPGMLYDPGYTYAVEFRSIGLLTKWGPHQTPETSGAGPAWLQSLQDDKIDAVLVHANSPEDRTLAAAGSGYTLVYDQPDRKPPRKARLYRRAADRDASSPSGGRGGPDSSSIPGPP